MLAFVIRDEPIPWITVTEQSVSTCHLVKSKASSLAQREITSRHLRPPGAVLSPFTFLSPDKAASSDVHNSAPRPFPYPAEDPVVLGAILVVWGLFFIEPHLHRQFGQCHSMGNRAGDSDLPEIQSVPGNAVVSPHPVLSLLAFLGTFDQLIESRGRCRARSITNSILVHHSFICVSSILWYPLVRRFDGIRYCTKSTVPEDRQGWLTRPLTLSNTCPPWQH